MRCAAAALLAVVLSTAGCGGTERTPATDEGAATPDDGASATADRAPASDDRDRATDDRIPALEVLFRVDSLSRPESVAWDSARDRWLITNVADGEEGTGSGFVTSVTSGGERVVRRAYDAATPGLRLDGPKGIAVRGERAFVADLRRVVAIDLAGDSAVWARELEGASFLNDVTPAPSGGVYVSDTRADAVWWVAGDGSAARRIGAAGSLRGANGLMGADSAGRVLVAGWEGAVLALAPDSSITLLAGSPRFGHLDGLQPAPDGGLLVSDFSSGRVYHLRRKGEGVWQTGVAWLTDLTEPADFLVRDTVLALPELGAGRVTFYRIGGR